MEMTTLSNQVIEFNMNGGRLIKLRVKTLRLIGEHFLFDCEPNQDGVWKNLRGGVQNIKRDNLRIIL